MISPYSGTLLDRSFDVAYDQASFMRRQGMRPAQVLEALEERPRPHPTWEYVIGRLARHWRMLQPPNATG